MGDRIHALAQGFTGKPHLDECSLDELQQIVNRHPYFAPAQFLLLQKLRLDGPTEEAEAQYRKAVLYFHDPLLFEHFIGSNRFYTEEMPGEIKTAEKFFEQEADQSPSTETSLSAESHPASIGESTLVDDDLPGNSQSANTSSEEEFVPSLAQADVHEATKDEPQQLVTPPPALPPQEPEQEASKAAPIDYRNNEQKLPDAQSTTISDTKTTPVGQELTFEPFHTVDYFASQGIKISQDELPKDKLGKQLKSFTEWLKTMKRLPAVHVDQTVESPAEKKIEVLADNSVSESDVVTEAMAEVWTKQGNTAKALDIYNKLSLQNPSKKAYFAAKIENLKPS